MIIENIKAKYKNDSSLILGCLKQCLYKRSDLRREREREREKERERLCSMRTYPYSVHCTLYKQYTFVTSLCNQQGFINVDWYNMLQH